MLPYHTILLDVTHFCSLALAISRSAIKRHIVHAGAVTAYSCNIPSSLSIREHEASCHSMIHFISATSFPLTL